MILVGDPTVKRYKHFQWFSLILLAFGVGIAPALRGLAKRVIREKIRHFLNFSIFRRKVGFDLLQHTIGQ